MVSAAPLSGVVVEADGAVVAQAAAVAVSEDSGEEVLEAVARVGVGSGGKTLRVEWFEV